MGKDDMIIKTADPSHFNIPMKGDPFLHRNLEWYSTDDNKVLGVAILDLVDRDYSWVMLIDTPEDTPGYCAVDMGSSFPTQDKAIEELHSKMLEQWGKMK
jgi:hypothetical protein